MNYISKTVFKQILPQFLDIADNSLEMEEGVLRLSGGQLKPSRINTSLRPQGLRLASSKYDEMLIEIPWFEFSSKAIKVSVERLEIELEGVEQIPEQVPEQPPTSQQSSKSYLQSFFSKLLVNMELAVKDLIFVVRSPRHGLAVEVALFNISLRNSNLFYEESANIRKTMSIGTCSVKANGQQLLLVNDVNFCLDYDDSLLKILVVIGRLSQSVNTQLLGRICELASNSKGSRTRQKSSKT